MPVAELTEEELLRWGERFSLTLTAPTFVTFSGDLGTGKTTLIRAITRALGALEPVTSQSYGLVQAYAAPRGSVIHIDLYRLRGPAELPQIGWEDVLRANAIVFVEWPERAEGALPPAHTPLSLEHVDGRPDVRRLTW